MSTHNIGFYKDLTKMFFQLSSNIIKYIYKTSNNMHHIFSSEGLFCQHPYAVYCDVSNCKNYNN